MTDNREVDAMRSPSGRFVQGASGNPKGRPKKGRETDGRFSKGTSGNPNGRPLGVKNYGTSLNLLELYKELAPVAMEHLKERVYAGDVNAKEFLMRRIWPDSPKFAAYIQEMLKREENGVDVAKAVDGPSFAEVVITPPRPKLPNGKVKALEDTDPRRTKIFLPANGRETVPVEPSREMIVSDREQWIDILNNGLAQEPVEISFKGNLVATVVLSVNFLEKKATMQMADGFEFVALYTGN